MTSRIVFVDDERTVHVIHVPVENLAEAFDIIERAGFKDITDTFDELEGVLNS